MQRALGIEVFNLSFFDPTRVDGTAPYGVIEKRPRSDGVVPNQIIDRVLNLLSIRQTHQVFGFTYETLMMMDPFTFEKVERKIHEYVARLSKEAEGLGDSLEEELNG